MRLILLEKEVCPAQIKFIVLNKESEDKVEIIFDRDENFISIGIVGDIHISKEDLSERDFEQYKEFCLSNY